MKSKMRITGNRTVIGIICIVLALGITRRRFARVILTMR